MHDVHNTRTGIAPATPPESIRDFYVWRDEEMFPPFCMVHHTLTATPAEVRRVVHWR